MNNKLSYKDSGVDIDAGNELVERIKGSVKKTFRPEVLTGLGGFGALFEFPKKNYEQPVLVSSTDGVGTKLKLAFALDKHDTVGIDLVAMCVNDIVVQGAEPLFFLDYIATGKVKPEVLEQVVGGIAEGCLQAGCSLIGGETAEMPGMYSQGEYDLAGFTVGAADKAKVIDGSTIQEGDVLLGLPSSGVHSNGYSLVRKVLEVNNLSYSDPSPVPGETLGQTLITPTKIYVKPLLKLFEQVTVKGLVHVTGGGFSENIPRILPEGLGANIDLGSFPVLPIFSWLQDKGGIAQEEMFRTFNMGIGMILVLSKEQALQAKDILGELKESAYILGQVTKGDSTVTFKGE